MFFEDLTTPELKSRLESAQRTFFDPTASENDKRIDAEIVEKAEAELEKRPWVHVSSQTDGRWLWKKTIYHGYAALEVPWLPNFSNIPDLISKHHAAQIDFLQALWRKDIVYAMRFISFGDGRVRIILLIHAVTDDRRATELKIIDAAATIQARSPDVIYIIPVQTEHEFNRFFQPVDFSNTTSFFEVGRKEIEVSGEKTWLPLGHKLTALHESFKMVCASSTPVFIELRFTGAEPPTMDEESETRRREERFGEEAKIQSGSSVGVGIMGNMGSTESTTITHIPRNFLSKPAAKPCMT